VSDWKKFKFKITGKVHDEDLTPLTIPMVRLTEYLADLVKVLGHEEYVHLVSVEKGSAMPNIWIEPHVYDSAVARMRSAQTGSGPRDASDSYRSINKRLKEDSGSAEIIDEQTEANVIEFPGARAGAGAIIRGIREQASVAGELRRIGGLDETIHLQLRRADGQIVYVEANEKFGKQLQEEKRLFTYIRINGIATWMRDVNGKWHMEKFRAQSFDEEPLINEPFGVTIDALKALPNTWADAADPFEELRKIRHGDDEPMQ
jgi:hypothetical protein